MDDKDKQNNESEVLTPGNSLDLEKRILRFFGAYPNNGNTNFFYYYLKSIISISFSLGFLISIWANIFINFSDSSTVIESLYFGLTQTTFISKLINLYLNFKSFEKLEAFLYLPTFTNYSSEQYKYILGAIQKTKFFANTFRAAVSVTILFFFVFPFLDNKLLPLPSFFPISVEKFRFILFPYQMISIIMNGYIHSSLDCIFVTLITVGSAQFEILKDNLRNIRIGLDNEDEQYCDEIIKKRLRESIFHHFTIIKYAYKIEDMFQFVQFVQFLASSIIICVTGFQIIITPFTDLKFLTLTLYFICNLIQVSMCCYFGHDILTASEGVGEACYMSDWYNCSKTVCRTIFIVMEYSKRPVVLTAGKFFGLTIQTLMQVLKTSYSYLALLRRMNEIREQ